MLRLLCRGWGVVGIGLVFKFLWSKKESIRNGRFDDFIKINDKFFSLRKILFIILGTGLRECLFGVFKDVEIRYNSSNMG